MLLRESPLKGTSPAPPFCCDRTHHSAGQPPAGDRLDEGARGGIANAHLRLDIISPLRGVPVLASPLQGACSPQHGSSGPCRRRTAPAQEDAERPRRLPLFPRQCPERKGKLCRRWERRRLAGSRGEAASGRAGNAGVAACSCGDVPYGTEPARCRRSQHELRFRQSIGRSPCDRRAPSFFRLSFRVAD